MELKDFLRAKETGRKAKDEWLQLISDAIDVRLDNQDDDSTASPIKFATLILNTETWQQSGTLDEELEQGFGVEATTKLYDFYRIPLERAGFDGTLTDLLEQWNKI